MVIGPGRQVTDLYYDWARLREVEEDGALLVRPDKHIGWRSVRLPADPERALHDAMSGDSGPGSPLADLHERLAREPRDGQVLAKTAAL